MYGGMKTEKPKVRSLVRRFQSKETRRFDSDEYIESMKKSSLQFDEPLTGLALINCADVSPFGLPRDALKIKKIKIPSTS